MLREYCGIQSMARLGWLCAILLAGCHSGEGRTSRIRFEVVEGPASSDRASTGGANWVDYDGDGDPDLFVTNGYSLTQPPHGPQADHLYRNAGRALLPVDH